MHNFSELYALLWMANAKKVVFLTAFFTVNISKIVPAHPLYFRLKAVTKPQALDDIMH